MIARIAGTLIMSAIVFVFVSLLVGLGVLWLTGGVAPGAVIGVICGSAAAFAISALGTAAGRSGKRRHEPPGDENERSEPPRRT